VQLSYCLRWGGIRQTLRPSATCARSNRAGRGDLQGFGGQ